MAFGSLHVRTCCLAANAFFGMELAAITVTKLRKPLDDAGVAAVG